MYHNVNLKIYYLEIIFSSSYPGLEEENSDINSILPFLDPQYCYVMYDVSYLINAIYNQTFNTYISLLLHV